MTPAARLARAIVFARDLDRLVAFYRDGLGLPVRHHEPGFVVLDAGGVELALHAIPEAYAVDIVIADPPAAREDTPIKLAFAVDDIEAMRAPLAALGGRLGAVKTWAGEAFCDGVDPEGNVVQLSSSVRVSASISDDELTRLLTRVYVDAGFTAAGPAASLFAPPAVRARGSILVARDAADELLGMIVLVPPGSPARRLAASDEAELHLLAVFPEHARRGVGRRLVAAAVAEARRQGHARLVLWTQVSMLAAQRLYARLGFVRAPARDWRRETTEFLVYELPL